MNKYKWRIVADCTDRRIVLHEYPTDLEAIRDFNWMIKDDSPQFLWIMDNPRDVINKNQIVRAWIESPEDQQVAFETVQQIVGKRK
ncbi:hypothetical protein [Enterococcus devriesei]|uniref:hypothetical protein n=1 Tax=Enterococcus devriesei TaxID=319970 RepID=UPI0036D414F7